VSPKKIERGDAVVATGCESMPGSGMVGWTHPDASTGVPDRCDLRVKNSIERGLRFIERFQTDEGSIRRENDGPLFLTPGYVFAHYATGTRLPEEHRRGLERFVRRTQNGDGGWGLHVEGDSFLFTTVLNYVSLRLLGVAADDPAGERARDWITRHGGVLGVPAWGKCWLAVLGLYEWTGVHPIPPEPWLLPRWFPAHPRRFWCHARVVHLALCWLYGARWQMRQTRLVSELRRELFGPGGYELVDWSAASTSFAGDVQVPHSALLRAFNRLAGVLEPRVPGWLRARALARVLDHVVHEDVTTGFICLGPVNKALNVIVLHAAMPGSRHLRRALDELPRAYLHDGEAGLSMQTYNGAETWDTAFAAQALAATRRIDGHRRFADGAWAFLDANQIRVDVPERDRYHRGPSKGGWSFSNRAQGWAVADCTAEALTALLELEPHLARTFSRERALDAIDLLLGMQNPDGGWPTYERIRGRRWLELLNGSELFADNMLDYSYVEATSSVVQALARARTRLPERAAAIGLALARAEQYLRAAQRADGSWEGLWGICFTYGTWFGVWGLRATGAAQSDPALRRAAAFLQAHQQDDGGWGESYHSCLERTYLHHPDGSQTVMTAWALLALLETQADGALQAIDRGIQLLLDRQLANGDWPQRSVTGVFNKTCMQNYPCYRSIMPVWALAHAAHRPDRI
jgi:squalene/oxidosqualene cyclase-like protein